MGQLRTQKRRRREHKTDYKLRIGLLKSQKPRIVIRRTNKYFVVQAVESVEAQDTVIKTVCSRDLMKAGLDKKHRGSLKSLPAGYATGLLFAQGLKKQTYIVDLGMARTRSGNRLFAVVKGLIDGGVDITAGEDMFPSEERLNGEHLKDDAKQAFKKLIGTVKQ